MTNGRHKPPRVLRFAASLTSLLMVACIGRASASPDLWDYTKTSPQDPRLLTVWFNRGICERVDRVTVHESAKSVEIGLYLKPQKHGRDGPADCSSRSDAQITVGIEGPVSVHLRHPLGDRKLIDRACTSAKNRRDPRCKGAGGPS